MLNILIEAGTPLGDTICMIPYIDKYANESNDSIYYKIQSELKEFFESTYKNINFITTTNSYKFDKEIFLQHYFTEKSLQQGFAEQLGYNNAPYIKPIMIPPQLPKPIKSKYVCIGVHSTCQSKYWNHPLGKRVQEKSIYWNELCIMLRKEGLVPVAVERDKKFGKSPHYNELPEKALQITGLPLKEAINYINHCEFYIGLTSGLSWIAHALGKKVAMISNVTQDWNEFSKNSSDYIRITNKSVCHGCLNKGFNKHDWYYCPANKNFECHTSITPQQVFESIKQWIYD